MINIIVFSKDRALQLDLFIRSFIKYVKDYDKYIINVLYTYSNDSFKNGYDKLINKFHHINFVIEKYFKLDLINLVNQSNEFTTFFVDDIVFKNDFDFFDNQMNIFKNDKEILCRSLRLQPGLTYCYAASIPISNPDFDNDNIFYWRNQKGDYGYPMSVDGNIFRTNEILPYILYMNYTNPNSFEGNMAVKPINLPKMICYQKSIIINNPCNIVQNNNPNKHGNENIDELNDKYLDDYIIDMKDFDNINNISCHQEIKINLKLNEK